MRKTQKKVLGAFGLSVVAATTVFAAFLPTPDTQAVSTMTDNITVRVVGPGPDVTIEEDTSEANELTPDKTIDYDYSGSKTVKITIQYTDKDDVTTTTVLDEFDANFETGSGIINLDLSQPPFGYGEYILTIIGSGPNEVEDEDATSFSYLPLTAAVADSTTVDGADVSIFYDPESQDIDSFEINVYDKNGYKILGLSPTMVVRPGVLASLDFGKYGLEDGPYKISVTALDENGEPLYKPYFLDYQYTTEPYVVPNTGGVFQGLNIARSDYLITGLIVFGIISAAGIFYATKNNNRANAKRGSRRK